jgi:hypothetical protein
VWWRLWGSNPRNLLGDRSAARPWSPGLVLRILSPLQSTALPNLRNAGLCAGAAEVYAIPGCTGVARKPRIHRPCNADPRAMPKKKTKDDPDSQHEEFKRVAREVGADAEKDADAVMRRLAQQKRREAEKKSD